MIFAGIEWTVTSTRGMRGYHDGSMGGVPDDPDEVRVVADGIADLNEFTERLYDKNIQVLFTDLLNSKDLSADTLRQWLYDCFGEAAERRAQEVGCE